MAIYQWFYYYDELRAGQILGEDPTPLSRLWEHVNAHNNYVQKVDVHAVTILKLHSIPSTMKLKQAPHYCDVITWSLGYIHGIKRTDIQVLQVLQTWRILSKLSLFPSNDVYDMFIIANGDALCWLNAHVILTDRKAKSRKLAGAKSRKLVNLRGRKVENS